MAQKRASDAWWDYVTQGLSSARPQFLGLECQNICNCSFCRMVCLSWWLSPLSRYPSWGPGSCPRLSHPSGPRLVSVLVWKTSQVLLTSVLCSLTFHTRTESSLSNTGCISLPYSDQSRPWIRFWLLHFDTWAFRAALKCISWPWLPRPPTAMFSSTLPSEATFLLLHTFAGTQNGHLLIPSALLACLCFPQSLDCPRQLSLSLRPPRPGVGTLSFVRSPVPLSAAVLSAWCWDLPLLDSPSHPTVLHAGPGPTKPWLPSSCPPLSCVQSLGSPSSLPVGWIYFPRFCTRLVIYTCPYFLYPLVS